MKKIIWWIGGGILLTTAVFFIPEQSGSMWPSVMLSSIAGFIYLTAFSAYWLPEINSQSKKRALVAVLAILVLGLGVFAFIKYEHSTRQEQLLADIRTYLEGELAYVYVNQPLHETLRAYHISGSTDKRMDELFTSRYDSLITEEGEFTANGDSKTLRIYLAEANSDTISLVGESVSVEGRDSSFHNYSGETGHYQVKGILTSGGVDYERTN